MGIAVIPRIPCGCGNEGGGTTQGTISDIIVNNYFDLDHGYQISQYSHGNGVY